VRGTEALCDDVTCSAVSCTNIGELHERLYAPFGSTPHFLEGNRRLDVTVLLHWALFVLRAHGVPSSEWLGAQFSFCRANARE
jgi:hypothetical protein